MRRWSRTAPETVGRTRRTTLLTRRRETSQERPLKQLETTIYTCNPWSMLVALSYKYDSPRSFTILYKGNK